EVSQDGSNMVGVSFIRAVCNKMSAAIVPSAHTERRSEARSVRSLLGANQSTKRHISYSANLIQESMRVFGRLGATKNASVDENGEQLNLCREIHGTDL